MSGALSTSSRRKGGRRGSSALAGSATRLPMPRIPCRALLPLLRELPVACLDDAELQLQHHRPCPAQGHARRRKLDLPRQYENQVMELALTGAGVVCHAQDMAQELLTIAPTGTPSRFRRHAGHRPDHLTGARTVPRYARGREARGPVETPLPGRHRPLERRTGCAVVVIPPFLEGFGVELTRRFWFSFRVRVFGLV